MLIGLYDGCGFNVRFDETSTFLGGSETWIIELAKTLSSLGHHVFVFCNCDFHKYKNITFIPKQCVREVSSKVHYDIFIFSRGIQYFSSINADKKGVILHDTTLTDYGENRHLHDMSSIYVLSEWSKKYFREIYGNNFDDKIKITCNGVHQELYTNTYEKNKSMVWSSCWERGLQFFTTYVLPIIRTTVPEFELKVCSYNKYGTKYDNVTYLGRLNKQQLAEEQLKSKIWCYPNLGYSEYEIEFKETFCITAVENALANNCIITTDLGGLGTTAKGTEFLSNQFYVNEKIVDKPAYGQYLAEHCIKALTDQWFTTFDPTRYTWQTAANDILNC